MIPANQLSSILQGVSNAAREIGEQVQARRTGGTAADAPAQDAQKPKARAKK
jgi:hypothetical protein